jgi:coatomer subunit gamma
MNTQNGDHPLFDILDSSLRHQADMVKLEAARKITEMDVTSRELAPAITVLQSLLNSPRPVLRFAAVRTLNKVFSYMFLKLCFSILSSPYSFLIVITFCCRLL